LFVKSQPQIQNQINVIRHTIDRQLKQIYKSLNYLLINQ
jgi:hypothetical protein